MKRYVIDLDEEIKSGLGVSIFELVPLIKKAREIAEEIGPLVYDWQYYVEGGGPARARMKKDPRFIKAAQFLEETEWINDLPNKPIPGAEHGA